MLVHSEKMEKQPLLAGFVVAVEVEHFLEKKKREKTQTDKTKCLRCF